MTPIKEGWTDGPQRGRRMKRAQMRAAASEGPSLLMALEWLKTGRNQANALLSGEFAIDAFATTAIASGFASAFGPQRKYGFHWEQPK